jgi:nicotinamide mononucleotide transporter
MMRALVAALRAMSLAELVSVLLGLAYLLLAVRRSRWCWVAGGVSSAILVYLSARARLPMQAALQVYYVLMSVYGFRHWSRNENGGERTVTTWPIRFHVAACAAIVAASLATARWLSVETQAAWPYLDSFTTWGSLFTTWLVARVKLENWIYWLVIDAVLAFLFGVQKLYLVALLSVVYLGIVVVGYFSWLKSYRTQRALA